MVKCVARDEIVHGCESPGAPGDGATSSAEVGAQLLVIEAL